MPPSEIEPSEWDFLTLIAGWNVYALPALLALVTALVAAWQWRFQATVRLDQWPDYLVADGLPWFLLVVMLLPGTRSVFTAPREHPAQARDNAADSKRRRFTWVSLMALLL